MCAFRSHSISTVSHICTAATQEWKILIWWNRHRDTHILSQKHKKSSKHSSHMNECTHTSKEIYTIYIIQHTHIFCFIWQSFFLVHFLARWCCCVYCCMLYADGVLLCVFAYATYVALWVSVCVLVCFCLFMLVNILQNTMDANENNRHKKWHKRRKL